MFSRTRRASRRRILRTSLLGGAASLITGASSQAKAASAGGQLREYWIQADSFPHNPIPSGLDSMSGAAYEASQCSFGALGFRAFTPNWGSPLAGDSGIGPNTGIPGPTIRAKVGDTIRIHFKNNDTHYGFPHSLHLHGVEYQPASDGAWVWAERDSKPGAAIPFGETYTYEYAAGPQSAGTWPYHDHSVPQRLVPGSPPIMEINAELGMMGILAITGDDTPAVDVENVLVMHDLYADDVPGLAEDFDCFNGYAYLGNTPVFHARVGQRVRWRVMAMGKEFHVFHVHGHRWTANGAYVDSQVLGPSTTLTLDYVEDRPGKWLYHCHVVDHMMGGMMGCYAVS